MLGQADPETLAALKRQLEDLRARCARGQATPAACAKIIELEAAVEAVATGRPIEDVVAKKKASRTVQTLLFAGLGVYLATIAFRFFRR